MMRFSSTLVLSLFVLATPVSSPAQRLQQREQDFMNESPRVGDSLPDVTVYRPDGGRFDTKSLRGHYTVLTFGCLT